MLSAEAHRPRIEEERIVSVRGGLARKQQQIAVTIRYVHDQRNVVWEQLVSLLAWLHTPVLVQTNFCWRFTCLNFAMIIEVLRQSVESLWN